MGKMLKNSRFFYFFFIPQVNLQTRIFIELEGNIPPPQEGIDVFKVGGEPALVLLFG